MKMCSRQNLAFLLCYCACMSSVAVESHAQTIVDGKLGWAGGNGSQADASNANWYYNWWHTKPAGADAANADWIPLVKYTNNLANKLNTITGYNDVDTVLVLNEPERDTQSDVTVAEAVSIWPQFEATGLNLITPGISDDPDGRAWLADFMTQANNLNYRMDGLAFHWYGASTPNNPAGAANNFLSRVDYYWNTYGLPVWITEFAIHDWGGNYTDQEILDANEQFLDIVVPALEGRSYVEAYSFYNWFPDSTIIEEVNGRWTPTNVGDAYVPSYTTGETLDLNGTDQGNDYVYLRGGMLTNTGAAINDAVRHLYAVDGTSQLVGDTDWGMDGAGWVEVNAGATLEKTGTSTVTLNGTPVNNRGLVHISSGNLRLLDGASFSDSGNLRLDAGTKISLGAAADRNGVSIAQSLDLHGVTIETNSIFDGTHTISGTTTLHNTATFSGDGLLVAIGPIAAPGGGGGGGIVKKGSGTLFVNANNTYEGNTEINEGTLRVGASASLTDTPEIQVKPGGTLDVTNHTGGYSIAGQSLKLEGQVAGSINATAGSAVEALDSGSFISGDLTVANSVVRVGGAGFNETSPPPAIVTSGLNLNFDAGDDVAGDASWIDTQSGQVLAFPAPASPMAVADGAVPGITAAYDIPTTGGADGLNAYFEGGAPRSLQDATFEVWFKVDSLGTSEDQVLFEAGGPGRGVALVLNDDQLSFNVNGDGSLSTFTLSDTLTTGWNHAVGVIDLTGFNDDQPNDSMSLYVNDALVGSLNGILIDDWSGGNTSGIGDVADVLGAGGTPEAYHDEIAIVRYYQNHAFDPNDVSQNYQAVTGSGVMLPTTMQIGGDYIQQADATLELDLLSPAMHDALDITGAAAVSGILEVSEISGFSPASGDSFTILSAQGGVSGEFSTLNLPTLGQGMWFVDYAPTEISLSVILGADFDGSGLVDARDFLILQRGLGLSGQVDNSNGDADGNGVVDQFDLEIWEAQYGTAPTTLAAVISTVPEPAGAALILLGTCCLAMYRSSRETVA